MHTITESEHDSIMAGLRLLQMLILAGTVPETIAGIATNAGEHAMPTPEELDTLCVAINSDAYHSD